MEIVDIYRAGRANLIELAPSVDGAVPVPATPGWTVKDVYAHLTGVAADILNQNMDGAGSAEWTAKQVSDRAGMSVAEICAEWQTHSDGIDAFIAGLGNRASFMGNDVWSHEQDIRGATEGKGVRDERAATLVAIGLDFINTRIAEAGVPAIRVRTPANNRTLGGDPPAATLTTDDYELLRMIFGRRTEAQIAAAAWEGDATQTLPFLHVFPYPESALTD